MSNEFTARKGLIVLNMSGGTSETDVLVKDSDGLVKYISASSLSTSDNYVTGATMNSNTLELSRSGGLSDVTVDLSQFIDDTVDGVVSGATMNGNTLELGRTEGLSDVTVDLSQFIDDTNDGVVSGATMNSDTLELSRTEGLGIVTVDLSQFNGAFTHTTSGRITPTNAYSNSVTSNYSTIAGGKNNIVSGLTSFIGGGHYNIAGNSYSFVGGGANNITNGYVSVIVGGNDNNSNGNRSFVGGGRNNDAYSNYSTIVGGRGNVTNGISSFIAGGRGNTINNDYSSIGGGKYNIVSSTESSIGGGYNNISSGSTASVIVGGSYNTITDTSGWSVIGGGFSNDIENTYSSFIGGGGNNQIITDTGFAYNTIVGGRLNIVGVNTTSRTKYSAIGGGLSNDINGEFSVIGGGTNNTITSDNSTIVGGELNTITHDDSHIIGSNITSFTANTTHVEKLNIGTLNGTTPITSLALDANGMVVDGGPITSGATNTDGIYDGSGTVPTTVDVTLTDTLNFDGGTLFLDNGGADSPGLVGVGTIVPSATLHVNGSVRFSGLTTTPAAGYVLQSTDALGNLDFVDVNTLSNDNYVTGATMNSNTLELSRSGGLSDVTVDLSQFIDDTNDGVVSGATMNGNTLELGRTEGLSDVTVDLSQFSGDTHLGNSSLTSSLSAVTYTLAGNLVTDKLVFQTNSAKSLITLYGSEAILIGQNSSVKPHISLTPGASTELAILKDNSNYVDWNSTQLRIATNHSSGGKITSTVGQFYISAMGTALTYWGYGGFQNGGFDNHGGQYYTAHENGTAPTTDIADKHVYYSDDVVAGQSAPHFRLEDGNIVKLYPETSVTTSQGIADALTNIGLLASGSTIAAAVDTNYYVTGFTYNNSNMFTVSVNDGNDYTATIDIMTGLTINGDLTVNGQSIFSGTTDVVHIYGSGSTEPVFIVEGSAGELFAVTDSLTGTLFSVSDISGLPIFEVVDDSTILMGSYLAPSLHTTSKITATAGSTVAYTMPSSDYTSGYFDYNVSDSNSARAGSVMAIWSGGTVYYNDSTTSDIGDTSAVSVSVTSTSGIASFSVSATTGTWTVKTIIRSI